MNKAVMATPATPKDRQPVPALVGELDLVIVRKVETVSVDDARRRCAASPQARLLRVDGHHDLRESLAPQAPTRVNFLRTACATPRAAASDKVA